MFRGLLLFVVLSVAVFSCAGTKRPAIVKAPVVKVVPVVKAKTIAKVNTTVVLKKIDSVKVVR